MHGEVWISRPLKLAVVDIPAAWHTEHVFGITSCWCYFQIYRTSGEFDGHYCNSVIS